MLQCRALEGHPLATSWLCTLGRAFHVVIAIQNFLVSIDLCEVAYEEFLYPKIMFMLKVYLVKV